MRNGNIFFPYEVEAWARVVRNMIEYIFDEEWGEENISDMIDTLDFPSGCIMDKERKVLNTLKRLPWSSIYEKSDKLLAITQRYKSLYYPVVQLTVMLSCMLSYALAMNKIKSMREKELCKFSIKSIIQRMDKLTSKEELISFYADRTIKKTLLVPIVISNMKTFEIVIVEEFVSGTKYGFIDLDGKRHETNSDSERKKKMNEWAISYVNKIDGASYFTDSDLYSKLDELNRVCEYMYKL